MEVREPIPRQVDKKSPGSWRKREGSGILKEEERTSVFFVKPRANDCTTKQLILLKDMLSLKLCILLEDMFLLLENLLTNPVILKCILWECVL